MIPKRRKGKYRIYRAVKVVFPLNGVRRGFILPKEYITTVKAETARAAMRSSRIVLEEMVYRPDIRIEGVDPSVITVESLWTTEIVRRK